MPTDAVLLDGPWEHRFIAANGARFHLVEAGAGRPVLLVHGYPGFWWTWRAVLPALAAAGHRAIAVDVRGFGGSDKPPSGYDLTTAAADLTFTPANIGVMSGAQLDAVLTASPIVLDLDGNGVRTRSAADGVSSTTRWSPRRNTIAARTRAPGCARAAASV